MQELFNTVKTVPDYQYWATLTQYRKSREIMKCTEHPKLPKNVINWSNNSCTAASIHIQYCAVCELQATDTKGRMVRGARWGRASPVELYKGKQKCSYNWNKMVSHKSKYLLKTLLMFVIFTFFMYSLLFLLCYVFRIKTPKLFGVTLLSLRRAIKHRFKYAKWGIVDCASLQPSKL